MGFRAEKLLNLELHNKPPPPQSLSYWFRHAWEKATISIVVKVLLKTLEYKHFMAKWKKDKHGGYKIIKGNLAVPIQNTQASVCNVDLFEAS